MTTTVEAAQAAYEAGLCVLPPREDGTKAPSTVNGTWDQFQEERPDPSRQQMNRWYGGAQPKSSIGLALGPACDNVEMFEFEGKAITEGLYDLFLEQLHILDLIGLWRTISDGYMEETPGGGIHVLLRTDQPLESTKLATRPMTRAEFEASLKPKDHEHFSKHPDKREKRFLKSVATLSETKGIGGYTIVAPSNGGVHPSGKAWVLQTGGFDQIATITVDERDSIYDVARSLTVDREPRATTGGYKVPLVDDEGDGPADRYNADPQAKTNTLKLLVAHGWEEDSDHGGVIRLTRPGKATKEGISATLGYYDNPPMFKVFSTSVADFDIDRGYTPFQVYAILEHGGDWSDAAKALIGDGYGDSSERVWTHSDEPGEAVPLPDHLRLYQPGDLGGFIPPISDNIIHGPIGEWLTRIEPETEAAIEALGAGVLAALGARLGPQVGLNVGRIRHRTNLLTAIVGPSGKARKGTADGEVRQFINRIDPAFVGDHIASGFGSGEAVVARLQDPRYDDEGVLVAGTNDQRLLVNEGELAQVFRVMSRQGSILADVLRNAFDGRTLENHTRKSGDIKASDACVSISGGITPDELVAVFSDLSGINGVGGRFLWVWSNPTKLLPDGGQLVDIDTIVEHIQHRGPHITYERTPEAVEWWHQHYGALRNADGLHPSIHGITNRTTDHVQRIALIYAASEGTPGLVGVEHLEAGLGWVQHSHAVVQSVLGGLVRDGVAGKILSSLRRHPGQSATMEDIYEVLGRNSTAAEVNGAIQNLTANGLAYTWKGESTGGRPPVQIVATTPVTKGGPK